MMTWRSVSLLDAPFPAVDRLHRREQVDAGREALARPGRGRTPAHPRRRAASSAPQHIQHSSTAPTISCDRSVAPYYRRRVGTKTIVQRTVPESHACHSRGPSPAYPPRRRSRTAPAQEYGTAPPAAPLWRRALNYLLVFATVVLLVDALVGERGWWRRRARASSRMSSQPACRELRAENARLRETARPAERPTRRRSSRVAREKLGLIRPGESAGGREGRRSRATK